MFISRKYFERTIDNKFIHILQSAYADNTVINKTEIAEIVFRKISRNEYHPDLPALLIDFDKGHGVCRPVPVFAPKDYFVYYFCIKKLEKVLAVNRVKGTFGGWRLGGAMQHEENAEAIEGNDSPGSGLNPAAYAQKYGEFNSRIKGLLSKLPKDVQILEIDIANFYDSIRIDMLQREIRAASSKKQLEIVDLLFYFLSSCNRILFSYRPQSTGIPQDIISDCSRLLANFYLQEYDRKIFSFCKRNNIKYLRFVDDQLFFMPAKFNPAIVSREASKILYTLGLNLNQGKVKTWNKEKLEEYRCLRIFDLLDITKTNKNQTSADCQKFAEASLSIIKKNKNENRIHGNGASLIKKCIGLGINKLKKDTRNEFIRIILNKEHIIKFLKCHNLTLMYKSLDNNEKKKLLTTVDDLCKVSLHASFIYEAMRFKRENSLSWRQSAITIRRFTREWLTI